MYILSVKILDSVFKCEDQDRCRRFVRVCLHVCGMYCAEIFDFFTFSRGSCHLIFSFRENESSVNYMLVIFGLGVFVSMSIHDDTICACYLLLDYCFKYFLYESFIFSR